VRHLRIDESFRLRRHPGHDEMRVVRGVSLHDAQRDGTQLGVV
jgi:hypothetical protein